MKGLLSEGVLRFKMGWAFQQSMGLYSGGLIIGRIISSGFEGLIFGRAYFWTGLLSEGAFSFQNGLGFLTVHGLIFGRAYYRKDNCVCDLRGLYLEGLIIGILRCSHRNNLFDYKKLRRKHFFKSRCVKRRNVVGFSFLV